ncbi:ubiquitin-conjugating enzyme/RWD-like protein [Mycena filopes]|nr:ubiquitin-conjugating enzyme/RWD-like protein [Mycena filopes]
MPLCSTETIVRWEGCFGLPGIATHTSTGMYVVPSPETLMVWDAVLFVHQGYYADAILKFRLTFPNNYPESPPVVQFVAEDVVFHPLVSHSGIFNLAPRFRPWRPKEHRVFDVLHWVKAAFKKHALDEIRESDCLNKEAYRLVPSTSSTLAADMFLQIVRIQIMP